jgi:CubicO group peptidase (beta-lactamase class C family)
MSGSVAIAASSPGLVIALSAPWIGTRAEQAPAANPRFDALASLAEAKMKEYGVPGVALGIVADGGTSDPRTRRDQRRGSAAGHRAHRLPDRVHLEDVRRDRDDAARRAGQGRPAGARPHYLPDFRCATKRRAAT